MFGSCFCYMRSVLSVPLQNLNHRCYFQSDYYKLGNFRYLFNYCIFNCTYCVCARVLFIHKRRCSFVFLVLFFFIVCSICYACYACILVHVDDNMYNESLFLCLSSHFIFTFHNCDSYCTETNKLFLID